MNEIEQYSYLWDGTQPGWTLSHIYRQTTVLTLVFGSEGPTLSEIKAVRETVSVYKQQSTANVFNELKGLTRLDLGEFDSRVGRSLSELCRQHGLTVEEYPLDKNSYLPVNELTNIVLVIENNELSKAVQAEALRHGVPVRHIEA